MDFDPGPGVYNLTGSIFIQKLDSSGNFLWAKSLAASTRINDFTLDANNNIYVTGHYTSTADFDPGPGVFNLTCIGAITDVFILKLDAFGNFIWARSMGGIGEDWGSSITADPAGNIYCCGHYQQSADLDPGPGVFNVTTLNSTFFIVKLNAAGNCIWAKSIEGTRLEVCRSFVIDANNNIYATGFFDGTSDFDPGPGIFNLTTVPCAGYIQKLDANGNFVWAKLIGGDSASVFPNDIALDANNDAYITGFFYDTIDFDPGPGVFNLTPFDSSTGMFILKLDAPGNFCWAKFKGGHDYYSSSNSIALDAINNIYTTGTFSDTVDFDLETGVYNLTNSGSPDIFIQKISQCGMISYDLGSDTTVCVGSSFIITGQLAGQADAFKNASYVWQDNSTDSFYTPVQSGLYSVTASIGNCSISDSIFVTIDKPVTVDLGNDSILCEGEILILRAANTNANYLWQDNSRDSTFEVIKNGTYHVLVSNTCGINSDEIKVTFENCECILVPNSFTPNNDGLNDYFSSTARDDFSEYNLTIFNRWGEKMFESENPLIHWDGGYKEEYSSAEIYIQIVL